MLKNDPNLAFLFYGIGASAISAFTRRASTNMKRLLSLQGFMCACIDAFSCSLITTSIVLTLYEYYQCSLVYSIGIGTFVGSLGYNTILNMILAVVNNKLGIKSENK